MNRESAIETIKNIKLFMQLEDAKSDTKFANEHYEALDAAINSLEAWDKLPKEIYDLAVGSMELHNTDSQNFILIRESDVLNLVNKHLEEVTQ